VVFLCGEENLEVHSFVLGQKVRGKKAVNEAMALVRF
jgi:hypothetical protein